MEHDGFAVFCALDVAFNRVIFGDRGGGGGRGIFDQAELFGMEAPVRDRPRGQPVRRIDRMSRQGAAISNKASISTAQSNGNSATPTVDLAWRPLSPKTSTIKSDAPFITPGRLVKPGAALINPPSLTQREILVEAAQRRLGLREYIDDT